MLLLAEKTFLWLPSGPPLLDPFPPQKPTLSPPSSLSFMSGAIICEGGGEAGPATGALAKTHLKRG